MIESNINFKYGWLTLALLLAAFALASVPSPWFEYLLAEDGPVEAASAWLYLLAAACLLWQGRRTTLPVWSLALMLVHLAVREAGLRQTLLGGKGYGLAYYADAAVSLWQRGAALLLSVLTLLALACLVRWSCHAWRAFWRADPAVRLLARAFCYGAFAQVFDNWSKLFASPAYPWSRLILSLEEVFELGMALTLVLAVFVWRRESVTSSSTLAVSRARPS